MSEAMDDCHFRFVASSPLVVGRTPMERRKVLMRYVPGLEYYRARLHRLGLTGRDLVLDAGCGYGQWSAALATLNRRVVALEPSDKFLSVAREVVGGMGHRNVALVKGDVEHLPFRPGTFDAAVCLEVAFCVSERRMVRELARVLKPGSLLYAILCGPGYFLEYILHGLRHPAPRLVVEYLGYFGATIRYKQLRIGPRVRLMFQTPGEMRRELAAAGIDPIGHGPEAALGEGKPPMPLRRYRFVGLVTWWEILGRRNGSAAADAAGCAPNTFRRRRGRIFDVLLGALWLPVVLLVSARSPDPTRPGSPDGEVLIPTIPHETT